jgi:hypothetical protein
MMTWARKTAIRWAHNPENRVRLPGPQPIFAALFTLLCACADPGSLEHDTAQPLTEVVADGTHGHWALHRWPTLVLDVEGSCPVEEVDKALAPFLAAGIEMRREVGVCHPDHYHIEDGRVCLRVDDERLAERKAAGVAWWRVRRGAPDEITVGGVIVRSDCLPMVIAHEVAHVLGLEHSEREGDTMYPAVSDALEFGGQLALIVAAREGP